MWWLLGWPRSPRNVGEFPWQRRARLIERERLGRWGPWLEPADPGPGLADNLILCCQEMGSSATCTPCPHLSGASGAFRFRWQNKHCSLP